MALDPTLITLVDDAGAVPKAPTYIIRIAVPGDAAYSGTTGMENFSTTLLQAPAIDRRRWTILDVKGYSIDGAGVITHLVRYDKDADALHLNLITDGSVLGAGPTDLSALTFDLTIFAD